YLDSLDRKAMEAAENALLARANELVETVPGMEIIGTAKQKVPVMSFKIAGPHPSDIGTLLDQQGIAIRTGHHCAIPLMDFYGVAGTARPSFAFYNTLEDVEKFCTGLQKLQRLVGLGGGNTTSEVFTPTTVNANMTPTEVKHVRKQMDKTPEA